MDPTQSRRLGLQKSRYTERVPTVLVDNAADLKLLALRLNDAESVAIDTEFVWERTFYPRLGLVQLALAEDDVALVDAVALPDLSPLGTLIENVAVVKVLHDAQQDLTILSRATGAKPRNIFDSQLAAGFIGLGFGISLRSLIQALVGEELDKGETRTDWLRRPLSKKQLAYAEADVRFLPRAREQIQHEGERRGTWSWIGQEMPRLESAEIYQDRDPMEQYTRVKGAARLSPRELAVLRHVTAARELQARELDRPRGHIVSDETLISLAKIQPRFQSALHAVRGLSKVVEERHGQVLLAAVSRGLEQEFDKVANDRRRVSQAPFGAGDEASVRTEFLLAFIGARCVDRGIDLRLIGSRDEVRSMLADLDPASHAELRDHPLLTGWRGEFIGSELARLISGKLSLRIDPRTGRLDLSDVV
jgi:ribonuclease D